jgi:hypothetical protein
MVIETYLEKRLRRRPHQHLVRRGLRRDELSALSILRERMAA